MHCPNQGLMLNLVLTLKADLDMLAINQFACCIAFTGVIVFTKMAVIQK